MSVRALFLLLPFAFVACAASKADEISSSVLPVTGAADDPNDAGDLPVREAPPDPCSAPEGTTRKEQVCWRWTCGQRAATVAQWSGDAANCSAGDLDADAAGRALRLVNLHRFMADVDPIVDEPAWSAAAQSCALLAHANGKLSHAPPIDWKCWSPVSAATSSVSLIANRSVAEAINPFIDDPGNQDTLVHRRWLLGEELSRIGIGSTDHYACVVVDGHALQAVTSRVLPKTEKRGWVAWPPAGPVPLDVFAKEELDKNGWSVQSPTDDLDHSKVSVTCDGKPCAIKTTHLTPLHGSRSAIGFVPDGWKTEAGHTYAVRVRGAATIDFTVEPTDCF